MFSLELLVLHASAPGITEMETEWKGVEGSTSTRGSLLFVFFVRLNILSMISFEETILLLNIIKKHWTIPFCSFHHRLYYLFPPHHLTYCNRYQKTIKQFWTLCLEPSVCIISSHPNGLLSDNWIKTLGNFHWKTTRQQRNAMRPDPMGSGWEVLRGQ